MKLVFDTHEFIEIMNRIVRATPRKSTLPVLEFTEFIITGNDANVRATDQDVLLRSTISVEADENCSFLLHRDVMGLINTIKTDKLVMNYAPDNQRITIKTSSGWHKFPALDAEEYPAERTVNGEPVGPVQMSAAQRKYLADTFAIACSTDECRPEMTGVFVEYTPNKLKFTATDSYRLVHFEDYIDSETDAAFILPVETVGLLRIFDGDVKIIVYLPTEGKKRAKTVMIYDDHITLLSRVIDEEFPAYQSVMPNDPQFAVMDTEQMQDALSRLKYTIDVSSNQVIFDVDATEQKCTCTAANPDAATEGCETLTVYEATADIRIGFNRQLLSQIASHWDGNQVEMRYTEPIRPVLFLPDQERGTDRLFLLMPVRV